MDVAILGAGVAGLEAARVLHRHQVDFIVLEARERIGGRIFSVRDESLPISIELGAEFVHGRAAELREIAHDAPFAIADIDGQRWRSHHGRLRPVDEFWDSLDAVMGRLRTRGADRSFEQSLKSGRHSRRARSFALQWVENFHAADPARASEQALAEGGSPGDDARERRLGRVLGGYGSVAQWIGRDVGDRVRLGTVVTGVYWTEGAVRIDTRGATGQPGTGLEARAAIVALPLGVLHAARGEPGAVVFDPPLATDSSKGAALAGMSTGAVARVALRLREPFWTSDRFARRAKNQNLDRLAFLHSDDPDFPVWWTSYPISAPMLIAWRGGLRARELSAESEDQIIDRAVGALARQFGLSRRAARGMVTATWFHNWENDPYARGAYSYMLVGGKDAPAQLARPVRRTLFFAGEASDAEGRTGTVHGAIATGRRAAAQILRVL